MAVLHIKTGQTRQFEASFNKAIPLLTKMQGYIDHELKQCIEHHEQYLLLVKWESLEDHEIGFRKSTEYQEWKRLLHHFYDPFPEVLHYR